MIISEQGWDPLFTNESESIDPEIINAAKKREIRNILKSYVGMYDSFCELIQNAMDAVDKRSDSFQDKEYIKKIWITINIAENCLTVTDNGIGFNQQEFKSFLAPNISYKAGSVTRGNKGVGATYIAYGFNWLEFGTKTEDFSFSGILKDGRKWIDDSESVITRPIVKKSTEVDLNLKEVDSGSTFTIKFGGENIRPKNLNWFGASTPEQWVFLLLTKTPLGCLSHFDLGNKRSEIKFDLTVIDSQKQENKKQDITAEYIYPHTKIMASLNLKDVVTLQKKLIDSGRDPSILPTKFYRSNGLYEFFTQEEVEDLISNRDNLGDKKELIKEHEITAYSYFVYSTSIWDELNDRQVKLRKGYRVLKGGLQLATNQMIQGEMITIPLTSNIGYQNQCHVIVHFNNADPDLGRKGFQPELKEIAEMIATSIVTKFRKRKGFLKNDTGSAPSIEKEIALNSWIKDEEKHEEEKPLILTNKTFFAPTHEISIASEPRSEQDTIVLFNQLIAGGVIRGIRLLATGQKTQYDSLYRFIVKEPLANHTFNKLSNPLGVVELHHSCEITSHPKILEYKFNLDGLIREFENGEKQEKDVNLVVTWEMGKEWQRSYEIISFLDIDNLHHRAFHGLTHVLTSANTRFYVIALSELVNYLNNFDTAQEYQRKQYKNQDFIFE